ncbi:MAG: PQQ-binding-like beta-propeller repeat protein [Christensenella sp.]|uniref:outer membrane protein assembly factor BamB family protein n=1 Tax=Christensenella sp. TaxID=1935934 RepID=UPI002B221385|nr:PQQ-binding-like beta-propeller repeat protein [Christensenella sp.]MEA5004015.1 PQQ-binding-like beta-propeller repeat protein [Christensenella sp.]
MRIGRLIVLLLIFAAIVAGIVFGIMFLTKTGIFGAAFSDPVSVVLPSASPSSTDNLSATAVDATLPSAFGLQTEVQQNGEAINDFNRTDPVSFPAGSAYTSLTGISSFRGNNYRDAAHFGGMENAPQKLEQLWSFDLGAASASAVAQPLVVRWDADMRRMMNLYDDKKSKDSLTEVILASADGKLYFMDLTDGSATRDPLALGFTAGGTPALDPRGYPLLYVGQGGDGTGASYMNVYSLIDGSLLYRCGADQRDAFAYRSAFQRFGASPLVASEADTLVWPGENGIVYTIRLNTNFDPAAKTISVAPEEPVKYHYTSAQYADDAQINEQAPRLYGFKSAPAAFKNYLLLSDNGGLLQCLDLNTMSPVYAQDVGGASDAALVFEHTGDSASLYLGTYDAAGAAHICKLNALSGETVWQKDVAGKLPASPVLGSGSLNGMVFFNLSGSDSGELIAYNKETGDTVWQHPLERPGASSPAAVYASDTSGFILQCDGNGKLLLLDGKTGEEKATLDLGGETQGSVAVFGNTAVLQSGQKLFGVLLS